ncbi:MAG: type II toxin-antitoxin system HicA family toxin [Candidatus Sericytochromatia bacterium]
MKIPRDINGQDILKSLERIGYEKTKQTGSHMKLTKKLDSREHNITISNHNPIKIGTLNSIIKDLSENLKLSKEEIFKILF